MKKIILIILTLFVFNAYGQDKYNYVQFDNFIEVTGTEFVIATVENRGKTLIAHSKYLLFINTKTGSSNQVDFPGDANVAKPEQIKIDNLGINLILVSGRTVDLNGKSGIDWGDPKQLFILSTDGKQKTQLTEDKFFVRTWTVNSTTGTIVVAGHYDTNNNSEYDKTDKNEIHIYDLKTLKLVSKI